MTELKIAIVCSSNMNRSMEAHHLLAKKGFNIRSYGSGNQVKLPGLSADKPNVYDFDTTYDYIYKDLERIDKNYYTQNGILHMLDRNRRIKLKPERFQDYFTKILSSMQNSMALIDFESTKNPEKFDVIFTCEERVFDQVVDDLERRNWDWKDNLGHLNSKVEKSEKLTDYSNTYQPVHVINIDIVDNQEEATLGAFLICEICELMRESEDLDNDIDEILTEMEHSSNRTILHTLCFY